MRSMVSYPTGMAENSDLPRIYLGQIDPSAESRMPENYLAMGIPVEIARKMAQDIGASFLGQAEIV